MVKRGEKYAGILMCSARCDEVIFGFKYSIGKYKPRATGCWE